MTLVVSILDKSLYYRTVGQVYTKNNGSTLFKCCFKMADVSKLILKITETARAYISKDLQKFLYDKRHL